MLYPEILATEVNAGRLGFANAVHRLVDMSKHDRCNRDLTKWEIGMTLEMAHHLIHEAMNSHP